MKFTRRIVTLALTVLLIGSMLSISAAAADPGGRKMGVAFVTADSLRLREAPSTKSTTLDYASEDEVVVLLSKTGKWYQVMYNLQIGYMHQDYLNVTTVENVELGYGIVNGNSVNMRSGPGTSYQSYGKSKTGELAYIIGINKQWYKVIWNSTICYIRSDYLDLTEVPYENNDSTKYPIFFRLGKSTGYRATVANFHKSPNYFGYVNPEPSELAMSIVATAEECLGVRYAWGGESMKGFDCSGLVYYVFKQNGITLGRTCSKQYATGMPVNKNNLIPGDLVFFQNTYQSGLSHVGIYIGDGEFIHASSSNGVMVSKLSNSYWSSHYYGARRIVT